MSAEIKRATGLLVIEVVNSNPNGDPDRDGDPRQRPNGLGEISPVSFKRKLRDLIGEKDAPFFTALPGKFSGNALNFQILESRGREWSEMIKDMGDTTVGKFDQSKFTDSNFVKKYWDGRVFGNTILEKKIDKNFIKTGIVTFTVGLSISPVQIIRHTNTRKAGSEEGKIQGMAPLGYRIVEHGVYCMPFFVNPNYAHKTGCTTDDIELLKLVIPHAYDQTKSAIRPDVRLRHAWYIEHKGILGSCPEYLLVEALTPKRKSDAEKASNSWEDYIDIKDLPDTLKSKVFSFKDLIEG